MPRIPTVGNVLRVLALFDFRSMILGLDVCPIRILPQDLHRIQKRLHPILQKGRQLGLPAPKLLWPHVENVLFAMIKSLMIYLIYQGILYIDLPPVEKKI